MAEGNERRTELPAFSETRPVLVGTVVWALLIVVGLVVRPQLIDHDRGWWIWTAVAGMVLGCFGYLLVSRRGRKRPDQSQAVAGETTTPDQGATRDGATSPQQATTPQQATPEATSRTPDRS